MAKQIDDSKIKHLNPRIRALWALNSVAFAAFMWLLATVIAQNAFPDGLFGVHRDIYPFMFLMVTGVFLVPYLVWVELRYRNYTYYLADTEMIIRRGVLRIERTAIPFEKVQNVNVSRSVLERVIGLATLKIETAGTNPGEAEGVLPGIGNYRDLVDEILERVEHSRGTATAEQPAPKVPEPNAELLREISALRDEVHRLREEGARLKEEARRVEPAAEPPKEPQPEAPKQAPPEVQEKPEGLELETAEPAQRLEFEGERYKKAESKKISPKAKPKGKKKD